MLKPGYKSLYMYRHAGRVVYENKEKQICSQEMKEKKTTATPNKSIVKENINLRLMFSYVYI